MSLGGADAREGRIPVVDVRLTVRLVRVPGGFVHVNEVDLCMRGEYDAGPLFHVVVGGITEPFLVTCFGDWSLERVTSSGSPFRGCIAP